MYFFIIINHRLSRLCFQFLDPFSKLSISTLFFSASFCKPSKCFSEVVSIGMYWTRKVLLGSCHKVWQYFLVSIISSATVTSYINNQKFSKSFLFFLSIFSMVSTKIQLKLLYFSHCLPGHTIFYKKNISLINLIFHLGWRQTSGLNGLVNADLRYQEKKAPLSIVYFPFCTFLSSI